jgi:putative membrane protein
VARLARPGRRQIRSDPRYTALVKIAADVLTALVALLHVWFLVLEMFLWTRPAGLKVFRNTPERAESTRVLAANQGLYNGFLAAGLAWGLWLDAAGLQFKVFFLGCVIAAGLYGAWSVSRRILWVQAAPGAVALALVLLS